MTQKILLSSLSPLDRELAKTCMKNPNAKELSPEEISLFLKKREALNNFVGDKFIHREENDATNYSNPARSAPIIPQHNKVKFKTSNNHEQKIKKVANMITNILKTCGTEYIDSVNVQDWAKKIYKISVNYNVPAELIVSIIERESRFDNNVDSDTGSGPMQITTIAIQDFFPKGEGSRYKIYEMMDKNLLDDILYTDTSTKNLRAKSAGELRKLARTDAELGIKMGILSFEMHFVNTVTKMKFGNNNLKNIEKVIKGLKDGSLKLTEEEEAKSCVTSALRDYNSVFNTYAKHVTDTLKSIGVNFLDFNKILQQNNNNPKL